MYILLKCSLPLNDILKLLFLLFTDTNNVANSERIFTPGVFKDNSPTCDYCGFTATIPDNGQYVIIIHVSVYIKLIFNGCDHYRCIFC
jgi:hypothetical protein